VTRARKGYRFKKYNILGVAKDRDVWVPKTLDRIEWGDISAGSITKKMKGSVMVSNVVRVADGCRGASNPDCSFSVEVRKSKDLNFEAANEADKKDFVKAVDYLLKDFNTAREIANQRRLSIDDAKYEVQEEDE